MLNINNSGVHPSEMGLTTHLVAQLAAQGRRERTPRFGPLVERLRTVYPPTFTPSVTSSQGPVPNGGPGPTALNGINRSSHANHHSEVENVSYQQSEGSQASSPGNHLPSDIESTRPHSAREVTPNVGHVFGSSGHNDDDRAGRKDTGTPSKD